LDFGDGWQRRMLTRGLVDPQPANTECRFRIPATHLLIFIVDRATLAARLAEVGVVPAALESVAGTMGAMPRALALMEQAWAASEATGPAANLIVDAAVSGVVGMMLARHGGRVDPPPRLDDRRLARVVDYVEANLSEPIAAGELAAVAHVSLFHFTRIFRAATGRTPHAYLQARRVERAKAMLRGPTPLIAVAMACGFSSQSHFGEVFKAQTGATPGQWRRDLT
jgi:AraC family transcriptional regulator